MGLYFRKGKGWTFDFILRGTRFTATGFKTKTYAREAETKRRARKTSAYTANKDLRSLRAMFNFGIQPPRNWIFENPTKGIKFMPVEKKIKYVPPKKDILRVIMAADLDTRDYLWTIALTMGRMSEINRMTWQDVNLDERYVVLYTRKKAGGNLTPRKIPMPDKLHQVLSRRFNARDKRKPWVFWFRYCSSKTSEWTEGPYKDRKMKIFDLEIGENSTAKSTAKNKKGLNPVELSP